MSNPGLGVRMSAFWSISIRLEGTNEVSQWGDSDVARSRPSPSSGAARSELDLTNTNTIPLATVPPSITLELAQIPNGLEVALLLASFPSQGSIRADTVRLDLSFQHGRQTCRKMISHLVQTVRSFVQNVPFAPDGGEQPNAFDKDTLFAQNLSTSGRHLPSTNRLGLPRTLAV